MTFLLDTHIFIWLALEPRRISSENRAILREPTNALLVSTVSLWEIQIKMALGKITLPRSVQDLFLIQLEFEGIGSLPVLEHHIWAVADLPLHHRDPFDRLLIAQAIAEGYTLVTADAVFANYPANVLM